MCQLQVCSDGISRDEPPTNLLRDLPNSRRKKTKCSGERPICFHCRRNRLACIYEPYSATLGDANPPPPLPPVTNNLNNVGCSAYLRERGPVLSDQQAELLHRISTIESRLAELSGRAPQQNRFVCFRIWVVRITANIFCISATSRPLVSVLPRITDLR